MANPAKPVPEGYRTVTPHLVVKGAAAAIEFYKKAFGAEEIARMPGPKGSVMHAEIQIGDSRIMLNDEFPDFGKMGPASSAERRSRSISMSTTWTRCSTAP